MTSVFPFTQHTLETSPTVAINSRVAEMRARGERMYNLSVGEVLLDTPMVIQEAAMEAMRSGKTRYAPASGVPELRQAAADWMNANYGTSYTKDETMVTCGGKFALYALAQLCIRPGDEVLIVSPYWVSYVSIVTLFGGIPRVIQTVEQDGWKMTEETLRAECTPKTKILFFNNGGNPTGVLYTREEMEVLLGVAQEASVFVISDEVYSGLTYDHHAFVSAGSFPAYRDRVAVVQSCSKHFAMTGWRVGFLFADRACIDRVTALQTQSTTGTSTVSQWAALAAIQNENDIIPSIRQTMEKRRNTFVQRWEQVFSVSIVPPFAGLYCFLPFRAFGISETDSLSFCMRALEEAHVALVPGIAFGKEGYVRCSFGEREDVLVEGINTLAEWLKTEYPTGSSQTGL
ncbi:MAG TPA: aminotransferase class I/II-fold pyridoxal phosphate-dependent enzyme [Candidatus Kapabacteria bacterium]|nr:aminotransferase class I/II-fold pyridoxal phosphate-dependent enzyme [Candidatus Kapabacteria bacterium]